MGASNYSAHRSILGMAKMTRLTSFLLFLLIIPLLGCKIENGMEKHLIDAIELYSERQAIYRQQTDGRSDALFSKLIASETLSLGLARYFDARAFAFHKQGILIVEADFVAMHNNAGFGTPIHIAKTLDKSLQVQVSAQIANFSLVRNDIDTTVHQCLKTLEWMDAFERRHNVYLPMTKHIIESIGFVALHAPTYMEQSSGATHSLSRDLINTQILALRHVDPLGYDIAANLLHQEGIGILINDLPHIPFIEEYWLKFPQ